MAKVYFANRINWSKKGWRLLGDEAWFEYDSSSICPDRWIIQHAVRINGDVAEFATIRWYYTKAAEAYAEIHSDGGDWVSDWEKCCGIHKICDSYLIEEIKTEYADELAALGLREED